MTTRGDRRSDGASRFGTAAPPWRYTVLLPHTVHPLPLLVAVVAVGMPTRGTRAAITGDLELLRATATAYTDNRGKVRTWQGSAHVEMGSDDEQGPRSATKN